MSDQITISAHAAPAGAPSALAANNEDLTHSLWRYAAPDGTILAERLCLLPNGRIGGCPALLGARWDGAENHIILRDRTGRTLARFARNQADNGFTEVGGAAAMTPAADLPRQSSNIRLHRRSADRPRKNLVILRAGRESLHPQWAQDIDPADRNWDLCISWYGSPEEFAAISDGEYAILQNQQRKWPAIGALFDDDSRLWQYDYVMMPDDDMATRWSDINRCFQIMRDYDLHLAQPALAGDTQRGYFSHPITLAAQGTLLRYTSFVEVMIPVFSRDAIRLCLPSFDASHSGWGLDWVWASMLGYPQNRIAIIDEVTVRHTRPVGANYAGLDPEGDEKRVMQSFGGAFMQMNYGAIVKNDQ